MKKTKVAVLMGSKSDLPTLEKTFAIFNDFNIPFDARIISAHRTPDEAANFAKNASKNGYKVIICAAGMAAHLAGVIASFTTLPVIGIPMVCEPFNGFDAMLSMVQMPPGIPVGVVSAGKAGAQNAALLAISILSLSDAELAEKLNAFREKQREKIMSDDSDLQKTQ
jgi:phosphoribosylaminoimidazole carboxylase PurE protein